MMKNNLYLNFKLPSSSSKPYIYCSFVSTIDGKVFVDEPGYWPIGSEEDYKYFTFLRAHADVIIDGKGTAQKFGARTIETIHSEYFQNPRRELGKTQKVEYVILTKNVTLDLLDVLKNPYGFKPTIITSVSSRVPKKVREIAQIIKVDLDKNGNIDLTKVVETLYKRKLSTIFIDGGPQLIASLLEKELIDELFVTVAPKIFGNDEKAMTMVEGKLFPQDNIPQCKVISVDTIEDEIYIRYQVIK